ncbi:outer membrane beta-barrel protein [Peristeroidobacter agariperforans]|uniref:outer membrane beta-barrel protein n=1 Tax=Peristeroidobacter agariperforans TaxID=268404 RepID=UPI00101D1A8D|nr:outer membrane beta-barrel protein [Peristeroidobacter agariperforans]
MTKSIVAAIVLLAASGSVFAADNGIYLGGSVGQANLKVDNLAGLSAADFDGDDTAFKVIAGFRPLDWFAVEASYVDFGNPDATVLGERFEAEADGVSAFAVGFFALGPVDIFGKLGGINWDSNFSGGLESDGTDFAYGVGAQLRFLSLSVRAEYEGFDLSDVDDLNMISIGLTYTFL